ncbi:hypothetical protein ACFE04_028932 [Oxalis oulophora]
MANDQNNVLMSINPLNISDKDVAAHTVNIDNVKILTMVSDSDQILAKWLKEAKRFTNNTKRPNTIVVTLSGHNINCPEPRRRPFDLLVLSVPSSCFMFLPDVEYCCVSRDHVPKLSPRSTKLLEDFLQSRNVTVVGVGIETLVKKMDSLHGIKIANAVDLRELAEKHEILDKDLVGLSKSVLGKDLPEQKKIKWCFPGWNDPYYLMPQKVMYATAEAYFTFQIASALIAKKKEKQNNKGGGKFMLDFLISDNRLAKPGQIAGSIYHPELVSWGLPKEAGDAFVGALLVSVAKNANSLFNDEGKRKEALKFANACGALCTTQKGAIPALPTNSDALDSLTLSDEGKLKEAPNFANAFVENFVPPRREHFQLFLPIPTPLDSLTLSAKCISF